MKHEHIKKQVKLFQLWTILEKFQIKTITTWYLGDSLFKNYHMIALSEISITPTLDTWSLFVLHREDILGASGDDTLKSVQYKCKTHYYQGTKENTINYKMNQAIEMCGHTSR